MKRLCPLNHLEAKIALPGLDISTLEFSGSVIDVFVLSMHATRPISMASSSLASCYGLVVTSIVISENQVVHRSLAAGRHFEGLQ